MTTKAAPRDRAIKAVDAVCAEMDRLREVNREMLDALEEAVTQCACTLKQRQSGHLVNCWAPRAKAALQKAKGAK